jgi:sulfur carrier protein
MKVTINNKETEIQAKTIRELAQELDLPATGVAVAISNEMVPRDEWENTIITEGADIVIVKAFCGG